MSVMDKIKQLETKQKVILVIVIVLFIYLIYMAMDMFKGSSAPIAPQPIAAETPSTVEETPATTMPPTNSTNNAVQNTALTQPEPPVSKVQEVQESGPTPEQLALLAESHEMQRTYLKLVNEYQIAQLQEKLALSNAAIAEAQFKSAETLVKTETLQQKAMTDKMQIEQQSSGATAAQEAAKKVEEQEKKIQAVYVGKQRGSWVAMLDVDGNRYEVKIGTHLPNGGIVTSINQNGLVITKDSSKRFLAVPKNLD